MGKIAAIVTVSSALVALAYWYEKCGFYAFTQYLDFGPGISEIPDAFREAFNA